MQQIWIYFLFILSVHAKSIVKQSSNETLLIGQINGPTGGATRNLLGMILSMNVFFNNTPLHNSLIPLTTSTFPVNYSIVLNNQDFQIDDAKHFYIVSIIWQPAYIFKDKVKLPENDIDILSFNMRTIKFVFIRGEILHEKHDIGYNLPGTQVKLELIEEGHKGHVIDQVDFICTSNKYPCPFEYWLDTSRIKSNIDYKLEAILTNHILPRRKSIHHKYQNQLVETKSSQPSTFKINPNIDTEINDYKIIVDDV